jgi:hypothetical protein
MSVEQETLGQAIDEIVAALSPLDEKARSTAIGAACAHLGLHQSSGHPGYCIIAHPRPGATARVPSCALYPGRASPVRNSGRIPGATPGDTLLIS